jgi:nucleoside-diphosphate-sugar epimerase
MKAIVTGSGGLIGSECVSVLCGEGWEVIGIDNDMRREFFGEKGSTRAVLDDLAKLSRIPARLRRHSRPSSYSGYFRARAAKFYHPRRGTTFARQSGIDPLPGF